MPPAPTDIVPTQQQLAELFPGGTAALCPKAPGRPRASEAEARLHDLVSTAARLFLDKGYSKVSLEMIAREAHVAVRTIYVKFGGKAGLFTAVIGMGRQHFFATMSDLDTDRRPLRDVLYDFGLRFLELVTSPPAVSLHRMVLAEARGNPELAEAFAEAGPKQTREIVMRFFSRPDIRAQLRDDVPLEVQTVHLLNCILGDQLTRFLFDPEAPPTEAETRQQLDYGINLFLRGALK